MDTTTKGERAWKKMQRDWNNLKKCLSFDGKSSDFETLFERAEVIPEHCDVLIIGGGAIGSAIAYWLKQTMHKEEFHVVVVEKDPTVIININSYEFFSLKIYFFISFLINNN